MKISKDVILDLLPLYAAGEVSRDTRVLVEKYLETNPELAEAAREAAAMEVSEEIPNPLQKEDQMEAYDKAKHQIQMRIVTLSITIAAIFGFALIGVIILFFMGRAG